MAKINAVNNQLSGQSGTGSFAGSISPSFLGNIDYGASTLKIINSATPTLSSQNEIAIDTSITDFTGMLTYYDASNVRYIPSIPIANLSTTPNDIVNYDATNNEFKMSAPILNNGVIINYTNTTTTTATTTTSLTYVATNLTGSITPLISTSYLWIRCFFYVSSAETATGVNGYTGVRLYRTTGTPASLGDCNVGYISDLTGDLACYNMPFIDLWEPSGSTTLHTYQIQIKSYDSSTNAILNATATSPAKMIIYEVDL